MRLSRIRRGPDGRKSLRFGRSRVLRPMPIDSLDEKPLVSILISSFNYGRYLEVALESLRSQTYGLFEVVVCDDGSSDDSVSRIERYCREDDRFHLLTQPNSGQAVALNTGFAASRGSLISLLDADDFFEPSKLERVVRQLRAQGAGCVLHPLRVIDPNGQVSGEIPVFGRFERGWIAERVVRRGGRWRTLPTSALTFRREIAEAIFPIPAELRAYADGFVSTLLPLLTTVDFVEAPLATYRLHGENVTMRRPNLLDGIRRNAEIGIHVTEMVNERLRTIEVEGEHVQLDVSRNLEYRQRVFVIDLLGGQRSRPELLRRLAGLAGLEATDDLYSLAQRIALILLFGIAIIVPRPLRDVWLRKAWGLGPAAKRLLKRFRNLVS